jgi:hypothetical protein
MACLSRPRGVAGHGLCIPHSSSKRAQTNIAAATSPPLMSGAKRKENAMANQMHTAPHNPAWWTDQHASKWDHVKGALERDWEQTKADLSKNGGEELNQGAGDTVKQAVGKKEIPPLGVKTHPDDPKAAAEGAKKAGEQMEKQSAKAAETAAKEHESIAKERGELREKVGEVHQDLAAKQAKTSEKVTTAHAKAGEKSAEAEAKASEKIAALEGDAAESIAKKHAKIDEAGAKRDEATAKWHDAEQGVRYGYSVRSQYPADYAWDDKLESKLHGEWDALGAVTPWHLSRAGIHRGWDYAGKKS